MRSVDGPPVRAPGRLPIDQGGGRIQDLCNTVTAPTGREGNPGDGLVEPGSNLINPIANILTELLLECLAASLQG